MTEATPEQPPVAEVLVVDDNEIDRELLLSHLAGHGFAVREAADGQRAIDLFREHSPDLVLLDVIMPGLSGYDVCQRIRELPSGSLTPIIMVTSLLEAGDKTTAAAMGADDFVSKPVNRTELLTRMQSLLRIKRLADALDGAENTILALARSLEARDTYTCEHSERVGRYGARLGQHVGLSRDEQEAMRMAGLLHDIGKIGVCDGTLQNPGALDEAQWQEIRLHPVTGAEICKPLRSLKGQLPAIRHHHERWDGRGYPDGLARNEIPLGARIIAICDAWDAMISDRVYGRGMPEDTVRDILRGGAGTQWDAALVGIFLANTAEILPLPEGSKV